MKKAIYWIVGTLVFLLVLLIGLQVIASERVEVVELHTVDAEGEPQTTRLWVVDDEGFAYLRTSSEESGWFTRLQANGTFELTRNGNTASYRAELRRDKTARINDLMQEKYTWGDTLIGLMVGSRDESIAIELHPIQ